MLKAQSKVLYNSSNFFKKILHFYTDLMILLISIAYCIVHLKICGTLVIIRLGNNESALARNAIFNIIVLKSQD